MGLCIQYWVAATLAPATMMVERKTMYEPKGRAKKKKKKKKVGRKNDNRKFQAKIFN